MKIKMVREFEGRSFTEGSLFVDDKFQCFTVEDTDRDLESGGKKVQNETAIPRGIYPVSITMSTRFKKDLILISNVPGFSGIRIHSGNSSKDTEGCIIVGSVNIKDTDDWVSGSKVAYEALHARVKAALVAGQKVTLEVV